MRLALIQFRRAPLRTLGLIVVTGILIFLVEFLATISSSLQQFNTGALRHLRAGVLVYSSAAEGNLDASRLPWRLAAAAARVSGVADAAPVGVADFTAAGPSGRYELSLIGTALISTGAATTDGQILADSTEGGVGLRPGHQVVLAPGGTSLRVTGIASGIRYDGLITAWTTLRTWQQAVTAADPAGAPLPNAVAVTVVPGVPVSAVIRRLSAALPGTEVLTRAQAVADVPGASVLAITFDLLIAVTFAAAVLIIGSVFLIITVQRRRSWVLVRALGAPAGRLTATVLAQAALVVAGACVLAGAGLSVVSVGWTASFPVRAAPSLELWTTAAALAGAFVSSLLPVRRIARLDPASAMGRA